jgi:DNA-binding response OmpR family regulator
VNSQTENLSSLEASGMDTWPLILLIDDTSVTLELEQKYLHSVGFRVKTATTIAEIEKLLRENVFALAIVDTEFLGGQGHNVIRHMRKLNQQDEFKILATSVSSNATLRKKSVDAGASELMIKPTPRPKFLRELKKLTSQGVRGSERITESAKIKYELNGKIITADSLDLSSEGAHIAAPNKAIKPHLNTEITLMVFLPGHEKPVSISGEVRRHTQEGFGVRFLELSRTAQRTMDRFLTKFSSENKATIFYL